MLIDEIDGFDGEDWIRSLGAAVDPDSWLNLSQVFQLALLLYASAALSPFSDSAVTWYKAHREALLAVLTTKLSDFKTETVDCIALLWPTVVAGFAAQAGPHESRDAVRARLMFMSRRLGYQGPSNALKTLERFWGGEDCELWDECFDRCQAYIA